MGGDRVRDVDGIEMMTIITCFGGLRGKNNGGNIYEILPNVHPEKFYGIGVDANCVLTRK